MDSQTADLATPPDGAADTKAIELSVVIPTYNEFENVPLLIDKLAAVLAGTAGKRSSSMMIPAMGPRGRGDRAELAAGPNAMSASFSASGVAACPPPASRARCRVPRLILR